MSDSKTKKCPDCGNLCWTHRNRCRKCSTTGKRNGFWKGNKAGYHAMHKWVIVRRGVAKKCDCCDETKKRIHWANIDHKYKRNLDDYMALCAKCHYFYDKTILGVLKGRESANAKRNKK